MKVLQSLSYNCRQSNKNKIYSSNYFEKQHPSLFITEIFIITSSRIISNHIEVELHVKHVDTIPTGFTYTAVINQSMYVYESCFLTIGSVHCSHIYLDVYTYQYVVCWMCIRVLLETPEERKLLCCLRSRVALLMAVTVYPPFHVYGRVDTTPPIMHYALINISVSG